MRSLMLPMALNGPHSGLLMSLFPISLSPIFPQSSLSFFLEKPTVKIPASTVRALSGHWLWCSAVGTPSGDITITNNDEVLVTSSGYALIRVYDEGTYTCTAKNQAGIDSKEIQVSLTASKNTLLINNPFGIESWAGWEWEGEMHSFPDTGIDPL